MLKLPLLRNVFFISFIMNNFVNKLKKQQKNEYDWDDFQLLVTNYIQIFLKHNKLKCPIKEFSMNGLNHFSENIFFVLCDLFHLWKRLQFKRILLLLCRKIPKVLVHHIAKFSCQKNWIVNFTLDYKDLKIQVIHHSDRTEKKVRSFKLFIRSTLKKFVIDIPILLSELKMGWEKPQLKEKGQLLICNRGNEIHSKQLETLQKDLYCNIIITRQLHSKVELNFWKNYFLLTFFWRNFVIIHHHSCLKTQCISVSLWSGRSKKHVVLKCLALICLFCPTSLSNQNSKLYSKDNKKKKNKRHHKKM